MATILPFSPALGAVATNGATVKVTGNATPTSVSGALTANSNSIRMTNAGTVLGFVRVTAETTPVATAADIPLAAGASFTIANPAVNARAGLAVLSSTTTAIDVYFCPGEGGI